MTSQLLTADEFAKERGVSVQRIQQLMREGRLEGCIIVGNDGRKRIDSAPGHAMLDASMDPKASMGWEPAMRRIDNLSGAPTLENTPNYNTQRAIREEYQAKMAKLEYERESGLLVETEKVKLEATKIARMVRDALLNIPDRMSPQLVAMNDAFEIHVLLTQEIELSLQELGKLAQR